MWKIIITMIAVSGTSTNTSQSMTAFSLDNEDACRRLEAFYTEQKRVGVVTMYISAHCEFDGVYVGRVP